MKAIIPHMFRNEKDFADHIERALREAGYTTQREVPLRTGHRLDILATKDGIKSGVEVKFERRGLLDDLTKAHRLLRLPEVDEMYVCGPKVLIHDDARALAERLGAGLLAVKDSGEIEKLAVSRRLEPARLSLGGSVQVAVVAGGEVVYRAAVFNGGGKTAVGVEVFMVLADPFVAPLRSRARAKKALLESGPDAWVANLVCKVKKGTRPGRYPLLISVTAENAKRQDSTVPYEVRG